MFRWYSGTPSDPKDIFTYMTDDELQAVKIIAGFLKAAN